MKPNHDKKNNQDELNKVLYNHIGYNYVQDINKDIESNMKDIESIEIPESLDNWFLKFNRKFQNKIRNNKYKETVNKIISKVAVIFLLLAISVAILTATVDAFRVRILSTISRKGPKYIDIRVIDEKEEGISNIKVNKYYLPEYIPNGFKLGSISDVENAKNIIYINKDNEKIEFNQAPNGTNFKIDSEKATIEDIDINGIEGIIIVKKGITTLFWHNEEYSFYLSSSIEQEELILMARSIIKK